jgi:hypothetical protein
MKNIHLLPTEKPSRLTKPGGSSSIKLYTNGLTNTPKGHCKNYHLYITSDSEIKEGDWCLNTLKNIIYKKDNLPMDIVWKKIILTTDQDLIKDGVQSIDDEFLEWFVKNPTCEFVEVKHFGTCCGNQSITQCINCEKYNPIYKITIPQEEPKQETLEEYSNGLYKQSLKDDVDLTFSDGVKLGAKWQSERMYSEEELKNAIEISVAKALGVMSFTINEESFEQFKKK